jgi:hypothetical protein
MFCFFMDLSFPRYEFLDTYSNPRSAIFRTVINLLGIVLSAVFKNMFNPLSVLFTHVGAPLHEQVII